MKKIDEMLGQLIKSKGSDLHLMAGDLPRARIHGKLMSVENTPMRNKDLMEYLSEVMPRFAQNQFEANDGVDFAYAIEGLSRFRVNMFRHINGVGAVFRVIPSTALTLKALGMPSALEGLCRLRQGLILVTGKTGSGKSTTLAAMIDQVNRNRKGHIITIEDPIEFVHERNKCLISQREIGQHTESFASALRSALREDPDVILVGEMRDFETISLAVTAAETGILVMGTLHTNRASSTVDRIINVFPVNKQSQVRAMLSTSLRAVIAQQLVEKQHEKGQMAAVEVLLNTPAVANLIRTGKTDQLESAMQSSTSIGMQTMDGTLLKLRESNQVSAKEAYEKAFKKELFDQAGQ